MKRLLPLLLLFSLLFPNIAQAQAQSPWAEVFDENGNLRSDLIDLGVTTEHPEWMSTNLPFGQTLSLEANYHRFQTASGNIVVLPSASTLFFMAMNPQASGLSGSVGMVGTGHAALITFLGLVAGNSVDWNKVTAEHPEYKTPEDFWGAVISGQQNVWSYFSGWGFITTLIQMSWDDAAMRSAYLLYLNGAQNCAAIPGGCSGVANPQNQANICPGPKIVMSQPTLSIVRAAPPYPLVVGQDEQRRGADVQVNVQIPPVSFTWYEPIYEDVEVCRSPRSGEKLDCKTSSGKSNFDGVRDTESVFKECREHVEALPDAVASLQAEAVLDGASQGWINSSLNQTHYGAAVHQVNFALIPGLGSWSGGCDSSGVCTASGWALRVPFADPGTFLLRLTLTTSGTSFLGIPITQPRQLEADGTLQVYVTLPALVP